MLSFKTGSYEHMDKYKCLIRHRILKMLREPGCCAASTASFCFNKRGISCRTKTPNKPKNISVRSFKMKLHKEKRKDNEGKRSVFCRIISQHAGSFLINGWMDRGGRNQAFHFRESFFFFIMETASRVLDHL